MYESSFMHLFAYLNPCTCICKYVIFYVCKRVHMRKYTAIVMFLSVYFFTILYVYKIFTYFLP